MALRRDWWLLAINAVLIAGYLWASSPTWLEPQLRGDPDVARSGDAVVWFMGAFPLLILAAVVDAGWLCVRAGRANKTRDWSFRGVLLVVVLAWIAAHAINAYFLG